MEQKNSYDRKLRTRTLIQCGGLLSLSGLLELCDITEGEDLQSGLESYEKAATLLGILIKAKEEIDHVNRQGELEKLRKSGKRLLKQSVAKVVY